MRCSVSQLQHLDRAARKNSISFIGLGRMGFEMANNLFSKSYIHDKNASFVICDAIQETALFFREKFLTHYPDARLTIAATPDEATVASGTIISMLPSTPHVLSVYSNSIIPTLQRLSVSDTLLIDSTTLDVQAARNVAVSAKKVGARMVDAPVSGGVTGAKSGNLSFLVGGCQDSFQKALPTLELMGHRIIHCGPSGSGLGAKICNNLVLGVQQIVVAEAMLLGQNLGLNAETLASVINSSTGSCWASSVNNPVPFALPGKNPPCENSYEGGFATALMLKDMGLATSSARSHGSPLPMGRLAEDIYAKVIEKQPEFARKDFSSVYQFLKNQS